MAADVGVSLSQAEASVAAPFTSNTCDISSVLVLLKNGRSSLVTSFVSFKFMAMYSIIQFTTLSFLYTFGSALSDWQFIYMDLLLILPFGVLINKYGPSNKLSTMKPSAKLISSPVLVSLFLQMILQAVFQGLIFIETRRRFGPSAFLDGPNVENIEATSLAMFSVFLYLAQGLIFSEGKPHRQAYNSTKNFCLHDSDLFIASLIVYAAIIALGNCVLLLGRISWIDWLMQFVDVPWAHRLCIMGVTVAYILIAYSANIFCMRLFK
jgi:cation-transporting ATPase 13A3/4/5